MHPMTHLLLANYLYTHACPGIFPLAQNMESRSSSNYAYFTISLFEPFPWSSHLATNVCSNENHKREY